MDQLSNKYSLIFRKNIYIIAIIFQVTFIKYSHSMKDNMIKINMLIKSYIQHTSTFVYKQTVYG